MKETTRLDSPVDTGVFQPVRIYMLLCAFFLFSHLPVWAQYPWTHQQSPISSDLTAVSFLNDSTGYIASAEGEILRTTDGGLNWNRISQIEDLGATSIDFINPAHGWVAGNFNVPFDSAGIFETIDSGKTWIQRFNHIFYNFNEIQFFNDTTGWLAGAEISSTDTTSVIMYTTTSGFSWTLAPGPSIKNVLYGIHMRDEDNGIAFGDHGIFFQTIDGGMHPDGRWGMNINIPSYDKDLYRASNSGTNYGCVVGQDGFLLVTNNDWYSYQEYTVASEDTLNSVTGYSGIPQFYAVGDNGCIAAIRYAFFYWMISEETRVTSNDLNDICQVNDLHAWAVGDHGTILYHTNNYPPVAVDDMGSVRQDSSLQIHVLENDTDMDFDPLEIYSYSRGKHGVVLHPEASDYLEFYPDDDYIGMDTLQYVITDNKKGFDTAHVFVEIREAPGGPFTEILLEGIDVAFGNAIWGDVDNDDDYDIVVCGEQADATKVTWFLRNDEGTFVKTIDVLEGVRSNNDHAMAFTDLDMNGYLDFIITGQDNDGQPFSQIYMYNNGNYGPYSTGIPGVSYGSVDWADYDHDGDPDLLIMGSTESEKICHIYRNDGATGKPGTWGFTKIDMDFRGLDQGAARFVDFNRDQYTDIVITGSDADNTAKAYYYTNVSGTYMIGFLEGYKYSNLDLCDFNADGNVDLFFSGIWEDSLRRAGFLTYTDSFTELPSSIDGLTLGSSSWGDFDNDGDPDLVVCGINDQLASETQLYVNNAGVLEKSDYFLPGMASGSLEWGDYDADGDLDLLMSGYFNTDPNRITLILRNDLETTNEAPEAPDQLDIVNIGLYTEFHWSPGWDQESPEANLGYNFKLKRKKSTSYMIKPASNDSLILEIPGYASTRDTMVYLDRLMRGAIYEFEIQTVDAGFHVSPWAKFQINTPGRYFSEQDFSINTTEIKAAEWFYRENESNPVLLLTEVLDTASTLLQWTGTEFDTIARYPKLGSGHGQVALLDFNKDNEVDFSEFDRANSSMVIYISSGDTLRIPIANLDNSPPPCYDWGDYDRDGDPDLIITGNFDGQANYAPIYRNDGNNMVYLNTPIPAVVEGDIAWVDIDSDGDEDVVVTGRNLDLGFITRTYENRDGALITKQTDLPGLWFSSLDFADYDADGDMDMLLCGRDGLEPVSKVYNNINGVFFGANYGLAPNERGSCKWVDLNMDYRDDIVLLGYPESEMGPSRSTAVVYFYDRGKYKEVDRFEEVPTPIIATGDYDGNGYQDLVFAGGRSGKSNIYIYKQKDSYSYPELGSPTNLSVMAYGDSVMLTWDYPEGSHPPRERLTFNLRVGTQPGTTNILSPLADATGSRKVIQPGNVPAGTSWPLHGLSPDSTYYAAVQAVDLAFHGGPFSSEIVFNPVSGTMLPWEVLYSQGLHARNAEWVDIDSDSDPDLLMRLGTSIFTFENSGGSIDFESFTYLVDGSFTDQLLLTDPDKDNDADILLFSRDDPSAIYVLENTSGDFFPYPIDVDGLYNADVAVGDINNDGTQEIFIMGTEEPDASMKTLIYQQNADGYRSLSTLLVPVIDGEIHLVDIDRDEDLDLIRSGNTNASSEATENFEFIINKNVNNGAFDNARSHIPGLKYCDLAFGDYDSNGNVDILYTGSNPVTGMPKTYICENFGSIIVPVDSSLVQVTNASAEWFDYNNDGLLDFVLSGYTDTDRPGDDPDSKKFCGIYLNHGESFELVANLQTLVNPIVTVADVDMDGRQDIFLAGYSSLGDTLGILYRNMSPVNKMPPEVPEMNPPTEDEEGVHFTWSRRFLSTVSYNLRVGTKPGAGDVMSPLSNADGTRKVYDFGNVQQAIHYTLVDLDPGTTYYAAVQSIDKSKVPSTWSNEVQFTTLGTKVVPSLAPAMDVHIFPVPAREQLNVEVHPAVPGEVRLEVIDQLGRSLFSKTEHTDGDMATFRISLPETGLYLLRIRSGDTQVIRKIVVDK